MKEEGKFHFKTLTDGYNPIMVNDQELVTVADFGPVKVPQMNYIDGDVELF